MAHAATAVAANAQMHVNLHAKNPGNDGHAKGAEAHLATLGRFVNALRVGKIRAAKAGAADAEARSAAHDHYNDLHKQLKGALKQGVATGVTSHFGDGASPEQRQAEKGGQGKPTVGSGGARTPKPKPRADAAPADTSPSDAGALTARAKDHTKRSDAITDASRQPGVGVDERLAASHVADAHRFMGSAHYFAAGNSPERAHDALKEAAKSLDRAYISDLPDHLRAERAHADTSLRALSARLGTPKPK